MSRKVRCGFSVEAPMAETMPAKAGLARLLDAYDLGELVRVRRAERGFVNEDWIVETLGGCFFLKRYHPSLRRPTVIRAQHALIARLRQAGFPVPCLVSNRAGETLLVLEDECCEIQNYITGRPYDHRRSAHLEEAAVTLGRYHALVQGFAPALLCCLGDLYSPSMVYENLSSLAAAWRLDQDRGAFSLFRRLATHVKDLAVCFGRHGRLPQLVIHGDYYADNLLFEANRIVGVVDFDKARWAPRVAELAEALIYFASPRPGHLTHIVYGGFLRRRPLVRFLRYYALASPPGENELNALPDYIRCIWLQCSLLRLLESRSRPAQALQMLREVLALGDWARDNAPKLTEVSLFAIRSSGD